MQNINPLKKLFLLTLVFLLMVSGCTRKDVQETVSPAVLTSSNEENLECCGVANADYIYVDDCYITDAGWLSNQLRNEDVLILDARAAKDYEKEHIPGALNVQWQSFSDISGKPGDKDWGTVLSAKDLSKKFSEIGIDKNKSIVVYADNSGWGEDGRFVWMLRMAGLKNSKILSGGFSYWKSKGFEVSKDKTQPKSSNFTLETLDKNLSIDTAALSTEYKNVRIIDARDEEEFKGAQKYGEVRGGHIPGAVNIPFNKVFKEDGTIKNQKELCDLFAAAGIKKDDVIVPYCTAGIRSAHMTMILKMAGYNNVKNYDGSFYSWAGDKSLPVEK